jgi:hypothetical protein
MLNIRTDLRHAAKVGGKWKLGEIITLAALNFTSNPLLHLSMQRLLAILLFRNPEFSIAFLSIILVGLILLFVCFRFVKYYRTSNDWLSPESKGTILPIHIFSALIASVLIINNLPESIQQQLYQSNSKRFIAIFITFFVLIGFGGFLIDLIAKHFYSQKGK